MITDIRKLNVLPEKFKQQKHRSWDQLAERAIFVKSFPMQLVPLNMETTLPPLKDSNGVKYYINDQKIWYIPVNINRSNAQNNVIELNYELEETEPFTVFASGSDSGFGLGNQTLSECPAFRKEVYQFNGMDENNGIVQNPGEYTASLMRSDLVTEAVETTDGITTKKYSLKGKGKHTLYHLHIDTINGN